MSEDKLADFERIKKIGEGSFGSIYLVKYKKTKDIYVLKKINTLGMSAEDKEDARMEFLIHKTLRSPYIVKYQTHFYDKNCMWILLEYMDGGDLGQYVEKQKGRLIDEKTVWEFFIQICLGIQYLHTRRILHRDLKTTNLFLNKDGKLKIGDLGVAKELKTNHTSTIVGTPYYLSPELCEEKPYNNKSDIWSLGCILYELCTLNHPFDSKTMGGLYLKIIKGQYKPIAPMYSKDLADIIDACLQKDGRDRPSIQTILENTKLQQEAKGLGFEIPTPQELTKEINLQKMNLMSTFSKRKGRSSELSGPSKFSSKFYSRAKTQGLSDKNINESESSKSKKPVATNSNYLKQVYSNKAQIDLISSEICDVVDDILQTSPEERQDKPSYLKYVRNPCSSKPNDSDFSAYHRKGSNNNQMVNQTEWKIQKLIENNSKNIDISCHYKRANTTQIGALDDENKSKIDDSILKAYQMINNKKSDRPSGLKPLYKVGSNQNSRQNLKGKNSHRKFTADDEDYSISVIKSTNPPSARPLVNIPYQNKVQKKSEKDMSVSSNSKSKNSSTKSAKSVKDRLSPNCLNNNDELKEPKSASKVLDRCKANSKPKKGPRKCTFDDVQVNGITIELSSLLDSTKESENGSGKVVPGKRVQKPKAFKRSFTKLEPKDEDLPSDERTALKFLPSADDDSQDFDCNAEEAELDEALNFADAAFEIPEDDDEDIVTPMSTLEHQPSGESCDYFEEQSERAYLNKRIAELQKEIKERWEILWTFSDEATVKKCFEFFRETIKDIEDTENPEKMEHVHVFIKKQCIPNFRAMGFECFRLLSSYIDLDEHNDKLIELDN